jgi:hypothetical protein
VTGGDAGRRPSDRSFSFKEPTLQERELRQLRSLREWYRLPHRGSGSGQEEAPGWELPSVREHLLATGYLVPRGAASPSRASTAATSASAATSSSSVATGGRSVHALGSGPHAPAAAAPALPHWSDRNAVLREEQHASAVALAATAYTRDYVAAHRPWRDRLDEPAAAAAAREDWRRREAALYQAARERSARSAASDSSASRTATHAADYYGDTRQQQQQQQRLQPATANDPPGTG